MLVRKITYTNYAGVEKTGEYYFNLNKAEVVEWLMTSGDYTLDKVLLKLSRESNGREIINIFKDLIYRSYGEVSLDGDQFIKTKEVKDKFMQTEAYSNLFMELVTDAKKASDFINAIIPEEMANEVAEIMAKNPDGIPAEVKDYLGDTTQVTQTTNQ